MTAAAPALSVDAIAVAVEDGPLYLDAGLSPASGDMAGLFGTWAAAQRDADSGLLAGYLSSVSQHSGIPLGELRMLAASQDGTEGGTDGADVAQLALDALGPPPHPQPFLLVQAAGDRDTLAANLPRLVHGMDSQVTEDFGVTHLGDLGGTAVAGLLSWWMDARVGATVLVVDQPLIVRADRVPGRLTAVALRFGGGEGPLGVLGWGEGAPPAGADRVFAGPGACGGWPDLHDALAGGDLRPGARVLVRSGTGGRQAWLLLRHAATTPGRRT